MARPTKCRKIEHIPAIPFFVPSEKALDELPENILKLEELEAIRLKDLEGLEQLECAMRMEVSRPTFQKILVSAREKVADSLINGKVLRIEGGYFARNCCPIKCLKCGEEWKERYENLQTIRTGHYNCPNCGSGKVVCDENCLEKFCHKNCCHHGRKES
jgi:predicted DNA-binding protein (UPF0251 family)